MATARNAQVGDVVLVDGLRHRVRVVCDGWIPGPYFALACIHGGGACDASIGTITHWRTRWPDGARPTDGAARLVVEGIPIAARTLLRDELANVRWLGIDSAAASPPWPRFPSACPTCGQRPFVTAAGRDWLLCDHGVTPEVQTGRSPSC